MKNEIGDENSKDNTKVTEILWKTKVKLLWLLSLVSKLQSTLKKQKSLCDYERLRFSWGSSQNCREQDSIQPQKSL